MNRWTQKTYNELWIEDAELKEFEQVIERLIEMQRSGAPILTPPNILRLFRDRASSTAKKHQRRLCPVIPGCAISFLGQTVKFKLSALSIYWKYT